MNPNQEIISQVVVESVIGDFLTKEQMIRKIHNALDNDQKVIEEEQDYINRLLDIIYPENGSVS